MNPEKERKLRNYLEILALQRKDGDSDKLAESEIQHAVQHVGLFDPEAAERKQGELLQHYESCKPEDNRSSYSV